MDLTISEIFISSWPPSVSDDGTRQTSRPPQSSKHFSVCSHNKTWDLAGLVLTSQSCSLNPAWTAQHRVLLDREFRVIRVHVAWSSRCCWVLFAPSCCSPPSLELSSCSSLQHEVSDLWPLPWSSVIHQHGELCVGALGLLGWVMGDCLLPAYQPITHTHTHTRTHARAHTHTHTHTHTHHLLCVDQIEEVCL